MTKLMHLLMLMFSLLILSCGGGGSGSSSSSPGGPTIPPTPAPVTYMKVIGVQPQDGANDVGYDSSISIDFDKSISVDNLINLDAPIGKLLINRGLNVYEILESGEYRKMETDSEIEALTLARLESGNFLLSADTEDGSDNDYVLSYFLSPSLIVNVLSISTLRGKRFQFTRQEMQAVGLFDQNVIEVRDSQGDLVRGSLLDSAFREIEFIPYMYFQYDESYTLIVKNQILSTQGQNLEEDFNSSFTIESIPERTFTTTSPTGASANPLGSAFFSVNYELYTNNDFVDAIEFKDISNPDSPVDIPFEVSLSGNQRDVTITPLAREGTDSPYLLFGTKYQITVDGLKLIGKIGPAEGVSLNETRIWEFTTAEPELIFSSFRNGNNIDVDNNIVVEFNFPVSPEELASNFFLKATENNEEFTFAVESLGPGRLRINPDRKLRYNSQHEVFISNDLRSNLGEDVGLVEDIQYTFNTEEKEIDSTWPQNSDSGIGFNPEITLQFNFPTVNNPRNFITIRRVPGQGGAIDNSLRPAITRTNSGSKLSIQTQKNGSNFSYQALDYVEIEIDSGIAGDDTGGFQGYSFGFTIDSDDIDVVLITPLNSFLVSVDETVFSITLDRIIDRNSGRGEDPLTVYYTCENGLSGYIDSSQSFSWNFDNTNKETTISWAPYSFDLPDDGYLESGCEHEISINPDLETNNGGLFSASTNLDYYFDTDYLEILSYELDYSYDDRVSTDTDISIEFSDNIKFGYSDSVFELIEFNNNGADYEISFWDSKFLDEIDIDPTSDLEYGTDYQFTIYDSPQYSFQDPIRADSGERLLGTEFIEFRTENMPIEVTGVSPTGFTFVTENIYLDTNFNYDQWKDAGYPEITFEIEVDFNWDDGSAQQEFLLEGFDYDVYFDGYEIEIALYENLRYSADYYVTVDFDFIDGEYFEYKWDFYTESGTNFLSAPSNNEAVKKTIANYSKLVRQTLTRKKLRPGKSAIATRMISPKKAKAMSKIGKKSAIKKKGSGGKTDSTIVTRYKVPKALRVPRKLKASRRNSINGNVQEIDYSSFKSTNRSEKQREVKAKKMSSKKRDLR
ncbi:MAG: Ig-like domain-containing protein [Bdellovibrionales bacterium]